MKYQDFSQFTNKDSFQKKQKRRRLVIGAMSAVLLTVGVAVMSQSHGPDEFESSVTKAFKDDKDIPAGWKTKEVLQTTAMLFYPGDAPDVLMQIIMSSSAVNGSISREDFCKVFAKLRDDVYAKNTDWKKAWDKQSKRFSELYTLFLGSPQCATQKEKDDLKKTDKVVIEGILDHIESANGQVKVFFKGKSMQSFSAAGQNGGMRRYKIVGQTAGKNLNVITRQVGKSEDVARSSIEALVVGNNKEFSGSKLSNFEELDKDSKSMIKSFGNDPNSPKFTFITVKSLPGQGELRVFDEQKGVETVPNETTFFRRNDSVGKGIAVIRVKVKSKKAGPISIPLNLDASQAE